MRLIFINIINIINININNNNNNNNNNNYALARPASRAHLEATPRDSRRASMSCAAESALKIVKDL